MVDPASWDLLDEDCSDISDWVDGDTDTAVSEVSPAGQFRFDTNTGAAGDALALRNRDIGSYPDLITVEIKLYHDDIGSLADNDRAQFHFYTLTERFSAGFCSDGLFIYDTDSTWTEIGTNLVLEGASKDWQIWRFLIDYSGSTGDGICNVYLKNESTSPTTWTCVAENVPCSHELTDQVDGYTAFIQYGSTTDDMVTHVDHIKSATGLHDPTPIEGDVVFPCLEVLGSANVCDIEGDVELPSLDVQGNTGAIGDVTLPVLNVLAEVFVGIDAQGRVTLPGLETIGFTGARCDYNLPSLGISGISIVGTVASGEVVLPIFNVEGQSFTDAIVNGDITLPSLRISASSIHGSLCLGEVGLPGIRVNATAKVGTICTGDVTLPCLIIEAKGGHIPIGEGNVVLPLLQVYSNASVLVDPRDGCHVLRYSR